MLINKRVKTRPGFMMALCGMVIVAMWLEHLLLLGPAWDHAAAGCRWSLTDGLMFIGFLGLMVLAVAGMLKTFPELFPAPREGDSSAES